MKKIFLMFLLIFLGVITSITLVHGSDDFNYNLANTYNYNSEHLENESHYNMSERNNEVVDSEASLTILTHGLGGDASHWSYNESTADFGYEEDTLITSLVKSLNNDVKIYKVKTDGLNDYDKGENLAKDWGATSNENSPVIVVFETAQSQYSNDYVYSQFDYAIGKIVLEIKENNDNKLPKINLIGHSRGGLINLLYALDHPLMVNQIFSIGTPYEGSSTASIDVVLNDSLIGSGTNPDDYRAYEGESDIVNHDLYSSYINRWNESYDSLYKNIEVYAMGGDTKYNFLVDALADETFTNSLLDLLGNDYPEDKILWLCNFIRIVLKWINNRYLVTQRALLFGSKILIESIRAIILNFYGQTNLVNKMLEDLTSDDTLIKENNYLVGFNPKIKVPKKLKLLYAILDCLLSETAINGKHNLVWENDGLVNLNSAIGESYNGFNRIVKHFEYDNCNTSKKASNDELAIVHNLETKDQTFINKIITNLDMNGKIKFPYLTTTMSDNTIRIDSYIGSEDLINIPSIIEDKTVSEIGYMAFAGTNATVINIPDTIKTIESKAFVDSANLEEVNILSNLDRFRYDNSFSECDKLKNINIKVDNSSNYKTIDGVLYSSDVLTLLKYPCGKTITHYNVESSAKIISTNAFAGSSNLESINLNNVANIDSYAFKGCVSLNEIVGDKVEMVGEYALNDTLWYKNQDIGIISLGSALIGYNTGLEINDSGIYDTKIKIGYLELENFKSISKNAFEGISNVEIIIGSNIKTISNNAFYNVLELDISVLNTYSNIDGILDGVKNTTFRTSSNNLDYYSNKVSDIFEFSGIEDNKIYKILTLYHAYLEEELYIGDLKAQDYIKVYKDTPFIVASLELRDKDSNKLTYMVEGLYKDYTYKEKYTEDYITIDEAKDYYVCWTYKPYYVVYHLEGGIYKGSTDDYIEEINYYNPIGFVYAEKPYCDASSIFKDKNGRYYCDSGDYNIDYFYKNGSLINDTVDLYVVWEPYRYEITYHEGDRTYNGGYYTYYSPIELKDSYSAYETYNIFAGWWDISYTNKYNDTTEGYSGNLDLYGKVTIKGIKLITLEYKITDSGRYRQNYDTINIEDICGISLEELKRRGYTTITISINIKMKEIDKGTQYIFLYTCEKESDDYLVETKEINGLSKDYEIKKLVYIVDINKLESNNLYIRFGASGKFSDDWRTSYRDYSIRITNEEN